MSDAICPDCGERNSRGTEFCGACGTFLAWDANSGGPADPMAAPPPRAAAPGPARPPAVGSPPPAGNPDPHRSAPRPTAPPSAGWPPANAPAAPPTGPPPLRPVPAAPSYERPGARRTWYQPAPSAGPYPTGAYRTDRHSGPPPTGYAATGPTPTGPVPVAPSTPNAPIPPPSGATHEPGCPRCGVPTEPGRRFCGKCGLALAGPRLHDAGPAGAAAPPERASWWHRIFRPAPNTRRAARAAYRHSLPLRYRLMRWGLALLGVGAVIGGLTLIGQNPVGWTVDRWNDLRGAQIQVTGLAAHTEPTPADATVTDAAPLLVDNFADTAWTVPWTAAASQNSVLEACRNPAEPTGAGFPESIVVTLPSPVTLTQLDVAAGLPEDDPRRARQHRPKTLQLAFTDGTCQRVSLADTGALQHLPLDRVESGAVRISVVEAYPPRSDQPQDVVVLAEIRLFQRP